MSNNINSNKLTLLLIIGIPVLGILLTTAYYFYVVSVDKEVDTRNRGVLIQPPKNIIEADIAMQQDGKAYQWTEPAKGHWTFMVAGNASCQQECRDRLYLTRQIRLALGKYQPRIERAYLNLGGAMDDKTTQWMAQEHPKLQVVNVDGVKAKAWFSGQPPALDLTGAANFYLVDPAGWVMMYYTDKQDYKDVIRDVKFLLKNS